ncbi:Gfo/Idh/MocA family protein [Halocatena halophila]|uniref:Gfo/Idh/MocA family protein n=1 Tax=Halocatena halophila TaxID=2814576 RepID=UPI0038B23DFE
MDMQTQDRSIAVGVVGIGSLGRRLAEQFSRLEDAKLCAIAEVSAERLATTGDRLGVPAGSRYETLEGMLSSEALDAVGIATPNGLHHEQVVTALEADCHVLCEKPLATTAREACDLVDLATSSDRTVMVGYQRHLNPAFELARERWATGERTPRFITGEITQDWREHFETMENWRMDPTLSGGGHLLNVGTHVIDAILWTTGLTPTHVTAQMQFADDEQRFDQQSAIILEFKEGGFGTIHDTGMVARTREHIHIWDGDGAVYLEGVEWDERTGYLIDEDGTEHEPYQSYTRDLAKGRAFLNAITDGTEPPATVEDGCLATIVTMGAYESARRGERIELAQEFPFAESLLD